MREPAIALWRGHSPPALIVLLGFVLLVELAFLHHHRRCTRQRNSRSAAHLIDTTAPLPWVIALAGALCSARYGCAAKARGFRERWDAVTEGHQN